MKALLDPSSLQEVRWHVVHQNILLEDYKAIYIPILKAACSTLKKICADLLAMPIPMHDIAEEIHLLHFPCAKKYKIKDDYSDYFKFAFVRNPWSRLVSCYNDKINYDKGHVYERYDNSFINYLKKMKVFSREMSFDRFVEVICDIPDEFAEAHFRSQYTFLTDQNGNILTDFIGYFEHLHADFEFISKKLGTNIELPHIRQGKARSYTDYYTNKSVRLVERRYEQDIEMFGYRYSDNKISKHKRRDKWRLVHTV
jgi:hypothetical protein